MLPKCPLHNLINNAKKFSHDHAYEICLFTAWSENALIIMSTNANVSADTQFAQTEDF